MSPVLVVASRPKGLINTCKYTAACMNYVVGKGYFPISKEAYENYMRMETGKFFDLMLQVCTQIYVFVDFGINESMAKAIEKAAKREVPIVYVNLDMSPDDFTMTLYDILEEISKASEIPIEELRSETHKREIVSQRFIYYRRAREVFGRKVTLRQIGEQVNDKDHASVLYGIKQAKEVKELIQQYEEYYGKQ